MLGKWSVLKSNKKKSSKMNFLLNLILFVIFLLILLILLISIFLFYSYISLNYFSKNFPPLSPSNILTNLTSKGYKRIEHFYNQSLWCNNFIKDKNKLKYGCVYNLLMPLRGGSLIICCDYKLGRLILSGNEEKSIPECEKSSLMKKLNLFDDIYNLLTLVFH